MKYLNDFIENAKSVKNRTEQILSSDENFEEHYDAICEATNKIHDVQHVYNEVLKSNLCLDIFLNKIDLIETFVFHDEDINENEYTNQSVDLPFEFVYLELSDGKPFITKPLVMNSEADCLAIAVIEVEPTKFVKLCLMEIEGAKRWIQCFSFGSDQQDKIELAKQELQKFCYILNSSKIAYIKEHRKFKAKISKGSFLKRKSTIHLGREKILVKNFPESKRHIEFDYSFSVRGHWRKVKGIGKNRAGEYNTEGYTWVKNYIKGDGELKKFERHVHGAQ